MCVYVWCCFSPSQHNGKMGNYWFFYDVPLSFSWQSIFFLQLPHRIYATYSATVMLYCTVFLILPEVYSCILLYGFVKGGLEGGNLLGGRGVFALLYTWQIFLYVPGKLHYAFLKICPNIFSVMSYACFASFLNFLP